MKKVWGLLLALTIVFLGACSQGVDGGVEGVKTKEMKLAVATTEDRSLTKGLVKFGELVEEKTNGSIVAEVFPNGQLGGDREIFESLQFNSIQGTTMSTGPIAQFAPEFNVFDLPFLFPDAETAYQVLDGETGTDILKKLESQNVVGLNYWENGFRHLTNGAKEVRSPDDIKGLKIRTLKNDLHLDIWSELGANPTPMAFTELFSGLQQGVVDGQENPVGNVTGNKFYEVQDYLTKTGHVYNASPFLISKSFWDELTDEEQKAVQEAADEARDYQRELNQKEDEDGFKFLAENGMTITDLTDEEKEQFFEKVQPVYEKHSSSIGKDVVEDLLKEIESLK